MICSLKWCMVIFFFLLLEEDQKYQLCPLPAAALVTHTEPVDPEGKCLPDQRCDSMLALE